MKSLEFWSGDSRFGLKLSEQSVAELLRLCESASPRETGGILLGHYSTAHDCALVTAVTDAPADSKSGRTWFIRGVRGLQRKLDALWRRQRDYYLGEWHFHPGGAPCPSQTDSDQMQEIAEAEQYHCPEPVLLIIGGSPPLEWSARTFVFRREEKRSEMFVVADDG